MHTPVYMRMAYSHKHQPTTSKTAARVRSILASRQSLLNMHRMKKPLHKNVKRTGPLLSASADSTTTTTKQPSSTDAETGPVISAPPQSFLTHAELLYSSLKEYKGIVLVNVYGDSMWVRHVYDTISVSTQKGGCPAPVMFKIYSQEHLSHEIVESSASDSTATANATSTTTTDKIYGRNHGSNTYDTNNSRVCSDNIVYKCQQVQPDSTSDMYNYIMLLSQPVPDKTFPEALKKDNEYYYTRDLSDTFDRVKSFDNNDVTADDYNNMVPFIVTCKV